MTDADKADGSARIELEWGGTTRGFRLGLGEIRELQRLTGYGVEKLFNRISDGSWFVDEIAETLRLGLEGAGEKPTDASALVQRYFHDRPKNESLQVAARILLAVTHGPQFPKAKAAKDQTETNRTTAPDASLSPRSTASE